MIAGLSVAASVTVALTDFGALKYIVALPLLVVCVVMMQLYLTKMKVTVELALWQLRRIYELMSRREDLGISLDSGVRLELELRLSEAAFILSNLTRFDHPEKFRQFNRVSDHSPFEVLAADSGVPPTATAPSPQTAPTVPPDYSASAT
ncbi:hypothetical protein DB30_02146 [Enhygromyxa salina]|uniref:Uncharacterized protein n=2 Tax=Enhygromyxa salina TaxID=215803 RepID=A0A0C1Z337_9BACT|nr:hypothetical protein DB30_02146 [Enhygromyxa salina]